MVQDTILHDSLKLDTLESSIRDEEAQVNHIISDILMSYIAEKYTKYTQITIRDKLIHEFLCIAESELMKCEETISFLKEELNKAKKLNDTSFLRTINKCLKNATDSYQAEYKYQNHSWKRICLICSIPFVEIKTQLLDMNTVFNT
jgi:hypothetical protein